MQSVVVARSCVIVSFFKFETIILLHVAGTTVLLYFVSPKLCHINAQVLYYDCI